MYRHCIFCSQDLGTNEAIEAFPVGESLAFDAWKGRLWATCRRCGRWNLAPIEERWEAVEEAERRFRHTRLRAHHENIGLATLPDGTRLIRVGTALPGELAAWRYGTELKRRRAEFWWKAGATVVVSIVLVEAALLRLRAKENSIVHQGPVSSEDGGRELPIRFKHLLNATIGFDSAQALQVVLPQADIGRRRDWFRRQTSSLRPVIFSGGFAQQLLGRSLVHVNSRGASKDDLYHALMMLERTGSVVDLLDHVVGGDIALRGRWWRLIRDLEGAPATANAKGEVGLLPPGTMLALEMLLHEEAERRALDEELSELEAAWREAEEIAAIADRLPDTL